MLSKFLKKNVKSVVKKNTIKHLSTLNKGKLILEDGTTFEGYSFGSKNSTNGEVVFSTNMVGYPESMTDPSFNGQIINLTYPMIGNYGIPESKNDKNGLIEFFESHKIWCNGLIIQDYSKIHNHWNSIESLSQWMDKHNVPGLYGIDTRELTKKLRENGSMLGKIVNESEIGFENIK